MQTPQWLMQEKLREIDAELTVTRAEARNIGSELISSQAAELETLYELERRDRLFRNQISRQLDHDVAIPVRDSAVSTVAAARSRLGAASMRIDELEVRSREVQAGLSEAMTRSRGAAAAVEQMERSAGRAPVASPAEGLLVASDVFPGTFGIASGPALLCVHTHVHQADITSLRLGQQALIEIYGEPAAALHAKVSAIAGIPINSPDEAAYPVTLSVENPESKRFAGASVRIRIETTPR
jgi:multidrug resistance efflux pump